MRHVFIFNCEKIHIKFTTSTIFKHTQFSDIRHIHVGEQPHPTGLLSHKSEALYPLNYPATLSTVSQTLEATILLYVAMNLTTLSMSWWNHIVVAFLSQALLLSTRSVRNCIQESQRVCWNFRRLNGIHCMHIRALSVSSAPGHLDCFPPVKIL